MTVGQVWARAHTPVLVTMIAAFLFCYLYTAATVENPGSDTSVYFELARSLRHDHRYWFNFEPHATYPPGFPLLLAGFMSVVGETFGPLVKLSVLLAFIGVVGIYLFVKRQRGPRSALAVTLMVVSSSVFYFYAAGILSSDGPYLTASVYALLGVEVATHTRQRWARTVLVIAVALLAAYLVLLRSIGLAFPAGLALWIAHPLIARSEHAGRIMSERLRRWLPAVLLASLALFAWTSRTRELRPPSPTGDYMDSYVQQILKQDPHQIGSPTVSWRDVPARIGHMMQLRASNAAEAVLNVELAPTWRRPWDVLIVLVFLGIVGLGFLTSLIRSGTILDCYVLAYGGVLLLWPFDEGKRFLYPLHPFLLVYGLAGLDSVRRLFRARLVELREPVAAAAKLSLLGVVVVMGLLEITRIARQHLHPDPDTFPKAATVRVATWVRNNTQPDDVIMDEQFAIVHRLTGRKTVRVPLTTDPARLQDAMRAGEVDFVVVLNEVPFEYYRPSVIRRFNRLRQIHPQLFTAAHSFRDGTIYRVATERLAERTP